MNTPKIGFELQKIRLSLDSILPLRKITSPQKKIRRYDTILASIREMQGLIEPLMVYPEKKRPGFYLLVDGHLRLHALRELGIQEADCIISHDDESYTFNARVNRLAPLQEHAMITKAVKSGVAPERIAAALNLKVERVRETMNLLIGIHPEAMEVIRDKPISPGAIRLFKRVKPLRQIEMAELMLSANIFTKAYAEALVIGTPKDQLVTPDKPKRFHALTTEEVARMEQEMRTIEPNFIAVEAAYGQNVLHCTLARGYIKKLLANAKVSRFLSSKHPDIYSEFEAVASLESL